MSTAAATVAKQKGRQAGSSTQAAPAEMHPFVRGATEVYETFGDTARTMTTSAQSVTDQEVPAFGFLRGLLMWVVATGGDNGAATVAAKGDAPFSAIENIVLSDVNGRPLVGPLSGYDLYLVNKFGGYAGAADPALSPAFTTVDADGNFSFILRIPVEVNNRDGLGSLPNQHSDSNYHVSYDVAASSKVYTTAPDTKPSVRVRFVMEAWSPPEAVGNGAPVMPEPPASGTTQHWTKQTPSVNSGEKIIPFTRKGNLLRTLILVLRDSSGVRLANTNYPAQLRLSVDTNDLAVLPRDVWFHLMNERSRYYSDHARFAGIAAGIGAAGDTDTLIDNIETQASFSQDTGVLVFDYTHDLDGLLGGEMRDQWLQTSPATRLELSGEWGASAAQLHVLTNDVSPNGNIYI